MKRPAQPERFPTARRRTARLAAALAAPFAAGWLASGSCTISACYEDCDPCWQDCRCSSHCHGVAGSAPRIGAHRARVAQSDAGGFVREIEVLAGPVLPPDPDGGAPRLAEFALEILRANADLFTAEPAPRWRIEAVHDLRGGSGVQLELESGRHAPARSNSVTLWFDEQGRLLATTQVVATRAG
jgi:hypothetical protein